MVPLFYHTRIGCWWPSFSEKIFHNGSIRFFPAIIMFEEDTSEEFRSGGYKITLTKSQNIKHKIVKSKEVIRASWKCQGKICEIFSYLYSLNLENNFLRDFSILWTAFYSSTCGGIIVSLNLSTSRVKSWTGKPASRTRTGAGTGKDEFL